MRVQHAEGCPGVAELCRCHLSPMRVLESLTPGGSEFAGDPQRCAATIRETRESQMRAIVRFKKQRDYLLAALEDCLRMVDGDGRPPNWDLLRQVVKDVKTGGPHE